MSYNTTARIAAAGAFPYFSQLKSFPRSNEISETLFKAKYPLFVREVISWLLIWPFEVFFDVDSKKVVRGLAKSHEITKFSISLDH
jgi:hypothetical protein